MMRRNVLLLKVSRNWTKKGLTSATHFPMKAVDPAELRDGGSTAKEKKVFFVTKDGDASVAKDGMAARFMHGVRNWSQAVRLQQPTGTLLMLMPCYWGTAMACTRALMFEGADPVVLCAPFIPFHLVVLFSLGSFTLRAAALVANDMLNKEKLRRELSAEELEVSPVINGTMTNGQAGGILTAHATIGSIVALNLSPAAITALCASLPFALLYPILQRTAFAPRIPAPSPPTAGGTIGGKGNTTSNASVSPSGASVLLQSSNQLIMQSLFLGLMLNMGIFVGYGAVLNRIDWAVCVPAYIAAALWTCLYQVILSYKERQEIIAPAFTNNSNSNNKNTSATTTSVALASTASSDSNKSDLPQLNVNIPNPFGKKASGSDAPNKTLLESITNTNVNRLGNSSGNSAVVSKPPAAPLSPAKLCELDAAKRAKQTTTVTLSTIGDKLLENKLMLIVMQFPIGFAITTAGVVSPQSIFFYIGIAWSSFYLSSIVDHANVHDRWSCATAYKRNVKYAFMVLCSLLAGNAFWAYASEYEPQKDKQSISEKSSLASAISFGNAISPRTYDASQFTWLDRFLKPAFVQGQAMASKGVAPEDIVIPAWMRREHFGENCSHIVRFILGGYVSEQTIREYELWWYGVVDHYNLLAKWAL